MKCDHCNKDLTSIVEYKGGSYQGTEIPAGKFCSIQCLTSFLQGVANK